ncbi:hypothetical protein [Reyranella soli]|uniref:hypothetical protein n=1 Tax=Reyranella soli TaxID=1230389 RepID=UPI0014797A10|nr:hypothetical protein [Reyranella soli]
MLDEDEAWFKVAMKLEPKDGRLYVRNLGDDDVVSRLSPSAPSTSSPVDRD